MTKTPKAEAENTTVAAEPQMIQIESGKLQVQPRTLMLFDTCPKPAYFYLEPLDAKRKAEEGNGTNQINRGVHQIDPNRLVSHCCVMPNLKRLAETGNPYPRRGEDDTSIVTTERWLKYVPMMHATWSVLKSAAGASTANEMLDDIVAVAKFDMSGLKKSQLEETYRVVTDCLRDLRLFGLATADTAIPRFKKTKWTPVLDASTIPLAS